ncbi:HEPN domain-containing protein [Marinobacterium weihaiense]|uniref:HEPN domain-containing protein n=1 Tax=Marinobacterium weihaiense TaxID=2851016 RepID=A0ABS6MFH1_9GAMM|nr:HEPN domain-containing protein [Marinobacterium weihaiense]MBV0934472.1 HEPN domain-containing protein [Marinobacterium weihaiense]
MPLSEMNIKKQRKLNNFADRCFRDVADKDYIAARLLFRNSLYHQFLWQSQQALEKYLKGILLYNRIPAKDLGHDLRLSYKRTEKLPFSFEVDQYTVKFIEFIDDFGTSRYLESSHHIYGPVLNQLDNAIWNIRRYCQPLDPSIPFSDDYHLIIKRKLDLIKESAVLSCQVPHDYKVAF